MSFIHPTELQRRRARCRPFVDNILDLDKEITRICNVCGSEQSVFLTNFDRYGYPSRTVMCLNCGLIYILDRFTAQGYAEFYSAGHYRKLTAQFKKKHLTFKHLKDSQIRYSDKLLRTMQGYLHTEEGAKLLDVGGSTGLVAHAFVKRYGYHATVLDPAPTEIDASASIGLETIVGSIEDLETDEKFDLILLCRTLEHVFDLCRSLTKIRKLLKPDGLFFVDIADFIEICRRVGPPQVTTKVDHCYWLTQETALPLFRSMGFELVSMYTTLSTDQIGFLLRCGESIEFQPVTRFWINRQVRRFRELETDWYLFGNKTLDMTDWLKKKAYKVKKRLIGE